MTRLEELALSLEYHDRLNPVLWDKNDLLKPKIRERLLKIAEVWRDFANIPVDSVKDILITGGNCNYNYTSKSDIDLHLLVDKNKIVPFYKQDPDFVDDYLKMKKNLWGLTHNIKIFGYPVELYAQPLDEKNPKYRGLYSIKNNKWILKPENIKLNFQSNTHLQDKIESYMHQIDNLIASHASKDAFDKLLKKIVDMRRSSLEKGGEFGEENLVFKELRNTGYLDKITKYKTNYQDKDLSLA